MESEVLIDMRKQNREIGEVKSEPSEEEEKIESWSLSAIGQDRSLVRARTDASELLSRR